MSKYTGPTANPEADAERFENEQEAADALRETAEREAPLIVLKALQGMKTPDDWFRDLGVWDDLSADLILYRALDDCDDTIKAYVELLTNPTQGAQQKLFQCMASWLGKLYAVKIYKASMEKNDEPS